jgi:uncharacterized protein YcfL
MKLKVAFLFFCLLLLTACNENMPGAVNTVPDVLIPEEQMIQLLAERHVLQERITNIKSQYPQYADTLYRRLERDMFIKYQTDSTIFYQNYNYYAADIVLFEKIYTQITDTLNARKEFVQKQ